MRETQAATDFDGVWSLDPNVAFLNHGSFGACPRVVLELQQRLRQRLERQPVQFYVRDLPGLVDAARERLAAFLNVSPGTLAWVTNATSGVNTVLRSLELERGDELLTTDHEYNACRNALNFVAERAGARVVVAPIPFPLSSPEQVTESILARVGPRTRLALIDHVTSPTGLVLPLGDIVAGLSQSGVDTLVDGAHAPGMLDLDVGAIGAAYYTGNCHKWICAPKGAAFLHVRADRQIGVRPLTISHGANAPAGQRSRFQVEFDWTGTDDPTAYLCVPAALDTMGSLLPGGWDELRARNRSLVLRGRDLICDALGVESPGPDSMIGSLAAVPLPPGSPAPPASPLYADPLQEELLARWGIEVPIVPWPAPPARLVRISAQLYNRVEQYERLAQALTETVRG